ncbi:MAG TPA: DoxX family protein [Myxococcota bacterium]|nr:DoxX family protein [Myxococcota bacterium]
MRGRVTALWAGRVLRAALFLFAGGLKLRALPEAVAIFEKFGGRAFMYFIGVCEVAGGVGILVPRTAGLAALCLALLMVGAVFSHVFVLGVAQIGPALIPLCVCSWVAYELRGSLRWAPAKA